MAANRRPSRAEMRVLPKFNGCSVRHGARILASKWREGVTPNDCRPFFENGEVCSTAADLPSRPGALPRRTGFLLVCVPRSARCRLTFLGSDRLSLGWDVHRRA